jgi:hypothetical protein
MPSLMSLPMSLPLLTPDGIKLGYTVLCAHIYLLITF